MSEIHDPNSHDTIQVVLSGKQIDLVAKVMEMLGCRLVPCPVIDPGADDGSLTIDPPAWPAEGDLPTFVVQPK